MFSHSLNGVVYSDASTSSTSSSPNSFTQSPRHLGPSAYTPQQVANQLHRVPDVPSTFLPSYYPEGRYASLDHELLGGPVGQGSGYGIGPGFGSLPTLDHARSHSPATWEKLSQAGPSTRNLLDGINITDPQPRTSRDPGPPLYRITPGDIASSLVPPGVSRASSSYPSFPLDPNLHSSSSTPQGYGTDSSFGGGGGSSGGGGGSGSGTGGVGGGAGAGGARYHPYTRDREPYGSDPMSASSSSISRNNANTSTYTNTTMPEPSPSSTAYPGNMYGNVPLPDRPEDRWDRSQFESEITGEDYAQALEIYSHMLEAVPSMRLQHDSLPPGGQRYDHLIDLASDGLSILTGRVPDGGPNQGGQMDLMNSNGTGLSTSQKRPGGSGHGNGDKKVTKCLGCGATETPEWRRGPMGPRTLCNACGLVHMKLQRKKKKLEEKTAAAAAAAAAAATNAAEANEP